MRAREILHPTTRPKPNPARESVPPADWVSRPLPELARSEWCLTSRDYALLERHWHNIKPRTDSYAIMLSRMIQHKLAEARIVLPDDVATNVVTGNSRVAFAIDGCPEECLRIVHWPHEAILGQTILVPTLLGVTLLGLSSGQRASMLRADGTSRQVELRAVVYQPEHERRLASLHHQSPREAT